MILKTNPSFVVMNDLMSSFYMASECLIIQRQQQPGGRGKGKSSLGSDLQAVLHLASQKGQLGGHGEDPTGLSSRAPRTERSRRSPGRWGVFLLLSPTLWSTHSGRERFE